MCGLFGVFTRMKNGFSTTNLEVLNDLAFVNQTRGSDSTGLVYYDGKNLTETLKEVGGWGDLIDAAEFKAYWSAISRTGLCAFGHGRAATKGKVTVENAHPFSVDKAKKGHQIHLVHNGTLESYQTLGDTDRFDVDSHWMADKIAQLGPEEALSKINGAIATIWFDDETKKVCVFRNDQRPLFTVSDKIGNQYIASDIAFLMYTKYRRNLGYEIGDIQYFKPNHLYVIDPHKLENYEKVVEIKKKYEVIDYSKFNNNHRRAPFRSEYDDCWGFGMGDANRDVARDAEYEQAQRLLSRKDRTLIGDISLVDARIYGTVFFDTRDFRTTDVIDGNGQTVAARTEKCAPYVENLRRIMKSGDEVHVLYVEGQNGSTKEIWTRDQINTALKVQGKAIVDPKPPTLLIPRSKEVKVRLKPGKRFRFHTRNSKGLSISHSAKCSDTDGNNFVEYSNDTDGSFKIGDSITLEVNKTLVNVQLDDGTLSNYATGFRVQPDADKMDAYIDFGFFTKDTPMKNKNIGLFTGKIARMTFADPKHSKETGAVVIMTLEEVAPTEEGDLAKVIDGVCLPKSVGVLN